MANETWNSYCGCTEQVTPCNTVFQKVDELPPLGDATRNHAYILPDNTVWVVNTDGTGFSQLNGGGTGETYDDTELKNRLDELESKPDNDTKYSLRPDNKTLLPQTSLKELIEAYNGSTQPLLQNPAIGLDFIQMGLVLGKMTFDIKIGNEGMDARFLGYSTSNYTSFGITTKQLLTHTGNVFSVDTGENVGAGLLVDFKIHYESNQYHMDCLLSFKGMSIPVSLDFVTLKEAFEANPDNPVRTITFEALSGALVTLKVFFDKNFYNDTKASVISRGRYKLNEL